ncbi:TRAP transporter small permease subunit [Telmatospirillum sp. J64-1]|uniref:TRAP transporter small permease subunit n=1 Tax=Telmatospirillum sp. J64-1 TaxID=2502183 RepID=UPI00115EBD64|nr:TRAP transporter small permease [Telmatospirillum sp. J64-1]
MSYTPSVPAGADESALITMKILSRPLGWLNALGAAWLLLLMALICADVIGRSFFNSPITGVAEIAAYSVVAITFLQLPAGVLANRITRTDLIIEPLTTRCPRVGYALEAVFAVIGAVMFVIVFYGSYPFFMNALARNEFYGVQGVFTVPTWPVRLIILIGAAATALVFCLKALLYLAAVFRPQLMPKGNEDTP